MYNYQKLIESIISTCKSADSHVYPKGSIPNRPQDRIPTRMLYSIPTRIWEVQEILGSKFGFWDPIFGFITEEVKKF